MSYILGLENKQERTSPSRSLRQLTLYGRVYNYWLMTQMIFSPLKANKLQS